MTGRPVRRGVEIVPSFPVPEILRLVKEAEAQGFDTVWFTDHFNNRNVYVALASVAVQTRKIVISPGITNPYLIHPAWTASASASLNELAGGRTHLGIGAGDRTTLRRIGVKREKPLARIREAVDVIRALHRGQVVDSDLFGMGGARLDYPGGAVPIYVGSQGPKMLELAGEIADGVLINGSHPLDFEASREPLRRGLEQRGRAKMRVPIETPAERFDLGAYTCVSVHADGERARRAARIVAGFVTAGAGEVTLQRHGIRAEELAALQAALGAPPSKEKWGKVGACVTERMVERFTIAGTPGEVVERLRRLLGAGVTHLIFGSPLGPDKFEALKAIGKEILPTLGA
ncbi:MAG: 5,10-methylenetetrahydromethanopterin reductase [Halobacteria archaeon]